ncbi:hypothetical protein Leryth_021239 [Lithospermum erythrorhizon]|nr:hypothetical protein Leryth_021239 [Lithospermum erythrorhizon]
MVPSMDPSHSPLQPSPSPSASPSSTSTNIRIWKPAAQRNLRNQWSKLANLRHKWTASSSSGRSHATSLVNSFLSQRYMDGMELGVLSDMPDIKKKACLKLSKQQANHQNKFLSAYKDMVAVVVQMVSVSKSMRCYNKVSASSPLAQFSSSTENENDNGDGGGTPVFKFWSIASFEEMAEEIIQMFTSELTLKRLLVMALVSAGDKKVPQLSELNWSDEFYSGEFSDLGACELLLSSEPIFPSLSGGKTNTDVMQHVYQINREVLQVYLTTWFVEVNIDRYRVDEIFAIVGEEMHVILA